MCVEITSHITFFQNGTSSWFLDATRTDMYATFHGRDGTQGRTGRRGRKRAAEGYNHLELEKVAADAKAYAQRMCAVVSNF